MKKTILLADDDPAVRRMLQRVLTEEDYHVLPAEDGLRAVEVCRGTQVDLVILDLNLPAQDGWEALQHLTTDHPLVPVIILTGRPNQLFPALASGVGALIEKPVDLLKLLATIRELLEEPEEARIARRQGRPAQFHYLPPQTKMAW